MEKADFLIILLFFLILFLGHRIFLKINIFSDSSPDKEKVLVCYVDPNNKALRDAQNTHYVKVLFFLFLVVCALIVLKKRS